MKAKNFSRAFFGDGDSSVFRNVDEIYQQRRTCDAIINVEGQFSKYHWTGAGEASIWSVDAIEDFCKYVCHNTR